MRSVEVEKLREVHVYCVGVVVLGGGGGWGLKIDKLDIAES